jgi:hypothetical protein
MVISKILGGLGNQMFQYTAGRAASQALGGALVLLLADNPHSKTDYRTILFKGLHTAPLKPAMIYQQKNSFEAWSPQRFVGMDVIRLEGHFQNLPAITPILPIVRGEFIAALSPLRAQLKHKYNMTLLKRAAFIHIRRGDYLKQPTVHWTQSQEYYEAAVQTLSTKPLHWYVLSDDIAWCKQQPWLQGKQFVDEPELTALAFMSLCEGGAVISNSTFSWWGATLAGAPTVYPTKWYKDEKPDLFPAGWVRG